MKLSEKEILYHSDSGPIIAKNIEDALRDVGLSAGDLIMVHSDVKAFGKLGNVFERDQFVGTILKTFLKVISGKGTLIVPTYTYSFCKKEVFDVRKSKSETGLFSEFVRCQASAIRSEDPIFSHAGIGPLASCLLSYVGTDCFGADSFYDRFYKHNGKIINFGKFFDITFIHYIEQQYQVSYRYMKKFSGEIFGADGQLRSAEVQYYVRVLPEEGMDVQYEMPQLGDELERQGLLRRQPIGASFVLCSKSKDCFDIGIQMLQKNEFAFLKYPPTPNHLSNKELQK